MSHTRKMDSWQRERNELDSRSLITKEARERMRRQSARDQLLLAKQERRDLPDPDDADDSSVNGCNFMR